jgi:hypothetical protein
MFASDRPSSRSSKARRTTSASGSWVTFFLPTTMMLPVESVRPAGSSTGTEQVAEGAAAGAEPAVDLALQAAQRLVAEVLDVDVVVDDFAVLAMDPAQAKLAFQVISERYDHRRSTAITTNRPFKDWTKVFPDALNAQVIAERLTERGEHFVMDGKGYQRHAAP